MEYKTTIVNDGNVLPLVNKLPVVFMQPMDYLLDLLEINCISYWKHSENHHLSICFDFDMKPNLKQIFAVFKEFEFSIKYYHFQPSQKLAYFIISKTTFLN